MRIAYFKATDTLYLKLHATAIAASRDLDRNTILDLDGEGNVCAITVEHASERTDVARLTVQGMGA